MEEKTGSYRQEKADTGSRLKKTVNERMRDSDY